MSPENQAKTHVLVAQQDALYRRGIELILESNPRIHVTEGSASMDDLVNKTLQLRPRIVVVDRFVPIGKSKSFYQVIEDISRVAQVILLVNRPRGEFTGRWTYGSLIRHIHGVCLKEDPNDLVNAVEVVARHTRYASPETQETVGLRINNNSFRAYPKLDLKPLTAREAEVFRLIALGYSRVEMADSLGVLYKTVDAHIEHIRNRLNIQAQPTSRRFYTRLALDMVFIDPDQF